MVREDVGRHNAVDKVFGHEVLEHEVLQPAVFEHDDMGTATSSGVVDAQRVLVVSGRTSFEIVQKAIAAGVPIVAGVSAPSSLAVSLAERLGVTLVGFLRGRKANVYSHPERVRA